MADSNRQSDRAARVRSLTRALEGACTDEQRHAIEFERTLLAGDVDALLKGAHPDTVHDPTTGDVLIHYAIGLATLDGIQRLIERGADVNYVANDGFSALLNAIHHENNPERRRELVRVLIDAGADLERVGINGYRPLHSAALTEDRQLVRMLLDAGADPHSKTTVDDYWTAIEEAEQFGAPRGAEAIREWLAEQP